MTVAYFGITPFGKQIEKKYPCTMLNNGITYFKNIAIFRLQEFLVCLAQTARIFSMSGHFSTSCMKGLKLSNSFNAKVVII